MPLKKTSVINDPLGQTHTVSPVKIDVFTWKFFCFAWFWKVGTVVRKDKRTDVQTPPCENSYHYQPWLWVGLVDQYIEIRLKIIKIETWWIRIITKVWLCFLDGRTDSMFKTYDHISCIVDQVILTLLNHEHERFVVIGIQIGVFHSGLLLLPYAFALGIQKFDLDIRICRQKATF